MKKRPNVKIGSEKKGKGMKNPFKILHITPKKECTYFLIREGLFIRSRVPRNGIKKLLQVVQPDLILNGLKEKESPFEVF